MAGGQLRIYPLSPPHHLFYPYSAFIVALPRLPRQRMDVHTVCISGQFAPLTGTASRGKSRSRALFPSAAAHTLCDGVVQCSESQARDCGSALPRIRSSGEAAAVPMLSISSSRLQSSASS